MFSVGSMDSFFTFPFMATSSVIQSSLIYSTRESGRKKCLKIYTSLAILLSIYFFATYPPADSFVIIHHCLFGFECNDMHFLFRCFLKWPVALNHSSFETLMWIPNMISWMVLIIILSFKTSPTCRTEKRILRC